DQGRLELALAGADRSLQLLAPALQLGLVLRPARELLLGLSRLTLEATGVGLVGTAALLQQVEVAQALRACGAQLLALGARPGEVVLRRVEAPLELVMLLFASAQPATRLGDALAERGSLDGELLGLG